MKKISKDLNNSEVVLKKLKYNCKKGANNSELGRILLKEQKGICAYSEEHLDPISDSNDIEHFNPDLKCTNHDSYSNWFKVKTKINFRKRLKEQELRKNNISFENILHPSDDNFEDKLIYEIGKYRFKISNEENVNNLIDFLELNLPEKIEKRRDYITRKRKEIEIFGLNNYDFFEMLLKDDFRQVYFLRAIQEEFQINIWEMIP